MNEFLPITPDEIKKRGWNSVDVVLITPDAYIDHPAFAMAIIGRMIEFYGYKIAILPQPDWNNTEEFKKFGKPNICFAISGGNMDSMINKYTHNKKIRSEDNFSPGGIIGKRPDRALIVYSNAVKKAYNDVPIIIGGIEATMRRFAHYDYWSDSVKKSILLDSKADILVYGMGEYTILKILKRLKKGENIKNIRDIRGTVYKIGKKEIKNHNFIELPSYEEVSTDKNKFCLMTKIIYENLNPFCSKPLIQKSDTRAIISNPPSYPLNTQEIDRIYDLPFTRKPHPYYKSKIPAYETVKNSVITHRGCFGGCTFCSLSEHQGKFIQSRSIESIKREIQKIIEINGKQTVISDIGGPTANMYFMTGINTKICQNCKKNSCLHHQICQNLNISHNKILDLLKEIKKIKGIKKVFIASGIRMDIALKDKEYISEIAKYHTGGYLKVAPEHTDKEVLDIMKKPPIEIFLNFEKEFKKESEKEQYLIPYFISAYPGTTLEKAIEMAMFLKRHNYKPLQINDFLPAPGEYATAIYYTEIDPITMKKIYVPKKESERKMHRALMQYFKKENIPLIIKALKITGKMKLLKELT